MTLNVGRKAPDIDYITPDGEETSIIKGGKETWVIFIPFAFTGVCTSELCDIRDNPNNYLTTQRDVVLVSCDSAPSQIAWVEMNGFKGSMVSDFYPHGLISKNYDNFNEDLGCSNRTSYLVGTNGDILKVLEAEELGKQRDLTQYA